MPTCHSCGGFVTPQFARVFGDNDDEVYGCRGCSPTNEILGDGIAKPDAGDERGRP